jgi:hypothetical protein
MAARVLTVTFMSGSLVDWQSDKYGVWPCLTLTRLLQINPKCIKSRLPLALYGDMEHEYTDEHLKQYTLVVAKGGEGMKANAEKWTCNVFGYVIAQSGICRQVASRQDHAETYLDR